MKKIAFHVSLNPSPEDKLTAEQLREIAHEYMERMGYGNQPYIVFKHKDISREHLHIVSLRVDEQGGEISDSHEYDRSMSVLRELERKYNLHPSIKGQEQTDKEGLRKVNYPEGNVKQQVSSVVRSCLRHYKCSSYGELRTLLEWFNVSIEERTGTIDGRNYAGVIYNGTIIGMISDGKFDGCYLIVDLGIPGVSEGVEIYPQSAVGRSVSPMAVFDIFQYWRGHSCEEVILDKTFAEQVDE